MRYAEFTENTRPFVEWMLDWYANLPSLALDSLTQQPETLAIASIDLIKGFCTVGPLASPRIQATVAPTAALFRAAWARGVRDIVLLQDSHPPDAVEFGAYPPHCITGTEEAETVDEFQELPFFDAISVIPKNSINPAVSTDFHQWLAARPQLTTFIAVGDCSDLCTYQLATHLRVWGNAEQKHQLRVIAPVSSIQTYDLPVKLAQEIGGTPHDGDFLHLTFLYSMMLNGIEVVRDISY